MCRVSDPSIDPCAHAAVPFAQKKIENLSKPRLSNQMEAMVSARGLMMIVLLSLVLATPVNSARGSAIAWGDEARASAMVATTSNIHGRNLQTTTTTTTANSTCPLDFSILSKYTWINTVCTPAANESACCIAALSGVGLAMAKYLRDTGLFELQDQATVDTCLASFQVELRSIGVTRDVASECFTNSSQRNSSMFIRSPLMCQGIETKEDFSRVAGNSLGMDKSCQGDLSNHDQCTVCVSDMQTAVNLLTKMNTSTSSECFDYVVIYAAGIVNSAGPWDAGTAYCIMAVETGGTSSSGPKIGLYIGIGAIVATVICVILGLAFWAWRRRRRAAVHREFVARNNKMLKPNAPSLMWYDWGELKSATHGFSNKSLLGEGGYGCVYKGVLKDGRTVAIKRFRNCTPEGDLDFLNEVEVISKVKHRHLVVLNGCCVASTNSDGHQRMLVYDYMLHGSLADYLFNKSNPVLEWPERRKIAIGMARGLAYLHAEVVPQIIHRDIKASNILLDENFNARVADFGLAKLTPETETHFTTHVAGTHGYVAPEYALYGQLTEKSDVYSFGVCLLELLSGRPALADSSEQPQMCLVTDWAWWLVKEGRILDILDINIRHKGPVDVMQRFIMVGILCAHVLVAFRPTMTEALRMLEGDSDIPEIPDRPLPLTFDMLEGDNPYSYSAQSTPRGSMSQRELLR